MRKSVLILLLVIAVLCLAPFVIGEKGYVLIAFNQFTIEGTLVSFAIMTLVAGLIAYFVIKLLRYVLSLYGITRFKLISRSERKKFTRFQQSMWQFVIGDNQGALGTLKQGEVTEELHSISNAMAAKAAINSGDLPVARDLLQNLDEDDQAKVATLYLAAEQPEMAELVLAPIAQNKKASILELRSYCQYLLQQEKWSELTSLLPRLEKKDVLSDAEWSQLFQSYFNGLGKSQLVSAYQQLSKPLKAHSERAYLRALVAFADVEHVTKPLVKMIKTARFDDFFAVLNNAKNIELIELQKVIQGALKKAPEDVNLLLSLAYVAAAGGNNELASKVFKTHLNEHNQAKHWRTAAQSYADSGDQHTALSLYQAYS